MAKPKYHRVIGEFLAGERAVSDGWDRLAEARSSGTRVPASISGFGPRATLVTVWGISGQVPAGFMADLSRLGPGREKEREALVGTIIHAWILDADERRNRLYLSEVLPASAFAASSAAPRVEHTDAQDIAISLLQRVAELAVARGQSTVSPLFTLGAAAVILGGPLSTILGELRISVDALLGPPSPLSPSNMALLPIASSVSVAFSRDPEHAAPLSAIIELLSLDAELRELLDQIVNAPGTAEKLLHSLRQLPGG